VRPAGAVEVLPFLELLVEEASENNDHASKSRRNLFSSIRWDLSTFPFNRGSLGGCRRGRSRSNRYQWKHLLELGAVVRLDNPDFKGQPLGEVVEEPDGGLLVTTRIGAQHPDPGAVVDGISWAWRIPARRCFDLAMLLSIVKWSPPHPCKQPQSVLERAVHAPRWQPLAGRLARSCGVTAAAVSGRFSAGIAAAAGVPVALTWPPTRSSSCVATNEIKFDTLFSLPLNRRSCPKRAPTAVLAANGGSLFGLKFLPTDMLQFARLE
jgi:hypothetical protein